jgi:hypothetical protein
MAGGERIGWCDKLFCLDLIRKIILSQQGYTDVEESINTIICPLYTKLQ